MLEDKIKEYIMLAFIPAIVAKPVVTPMICNTATYGEAPLIIRLLLFVFLLASILGEIWVIKEGISIEVDWLLTGMMVLILLGTVVASVFIWV